MRKLVACKDPTYRCRCVRDVTRLSTEVDYGINCHRIVEYVGLHCCENCVERLLPSNYAITVDLARPLHLPKICFTVYNSHLWANDGQKILKGCISLSNFISQFAIC